MKFIELFAGIGGFRYGLEACNNQFPTEKEGSSVTTEESRGGWSRDSLEHGNSVHVEQPERLREFRCVYANEWDKYAASIYRRHYGEIHEADITTVDVFPDHDLLTAGFPCQAFSVAGKRLGFQDTRGTLFFEIARILKSKRPGHFLLENVKGLLSHEQGQTFNTILGVLSDLGYRVEWMVLNSKHFGVPQNRERVFIIGHLRGECSGEVFPLRQTGGRIDEGNTKAPVVRAITAGGHSGGHHSGMTILKEITENQNQGQRVYDAGGLAKTLAGEAGGQGAKTGLHAMGGRNPDNPSDRTTGSPTEQRLELNEEGTTNTLTSVAKDNLWIENTRIRRLTPVECERLQGFSDGWTEGVSDTQRYKCLGNAVTTNVIQAIGLELYNHLQENE